LIAWLCLDRRSSGLIHQRDYELLASFTTGLTFRSSPLNFRGPVSLETPGFEWTRFEVVGISLSFSGDGAKDRFFPAMGSVARAHPTSSTNQFLREHLRQKRGEYCIQEEDHPRKCR
jgi:hypothetical protein